ncbi:MAG: ATP-binding protein [Oscillospiraceae bacterium]|nr:ATP-binding protein [Oscillospiraceae bacterium]
MNVSVSRNPCKCGWYGHPSGRCRCRQRDVERYLSRLSGPLLDRMDLFVNVEPLEFDELSQRAESESSAAVRARVNTARQVQTRRYRPDGPDCNAHLEPRQLRAVCELDEECQQLMRGAFLKLGMTARSYDRVLRVARTIADLDGSTSIQMPHLAEALQFRVTGPLAR